MKLFSARTVEFLVFFFILSPANAQMLQEKLTELKKIEKISVIMTDLPLDSTIKASFLGGEASFDQILEALKNTKAFEAKMTEHWLRILKVSKPVSMARFRNMLENRNLNQLIESNDFDSKTLIVAKKTLNEAPCYVYGLNIRDELLTTDADKVALKTCECDQAKKVSPYWNPGASDAEQVLVCSGLTADDRCGTDLSECIPRLGDIGREPTNRIWKILVVFLRKSRDA